MTRAGRTATLLVCLGLVPAVAAAEPHAPGPGLKAPRLDLETPASEPTPGAATLFPVTPLPPYEREKSVAMAEALGLLPINGAGLIYAESYTLGILMLLVQAGSMAVLLGSEDDGVLKVSAIVGLSMSYVVDAAGAPRAAEAHNEDLRDAQLAGYRDRRAPRVETKPSPGGVPILRF